mmetsp:Transcript_9799/g.41142  ORF Transcript_9799/g.41142 Transcript_9799/m.41142 type:complete len:216 (+) Transcript_9799:794-1441(+)
MLCAGERLRRVRRVSESRARVEDTVPDAGRARHERRAGALQTRSGDPRGALFGVRRRRRRRRRDVERRERTKNKHKTKQTRATRRRRLARENNAPRAVLGRGSWSRRRVRAQSKRVFGPTTWFSGVREPRGVVAGDDARRRFRKLQRRARLRGARARGGALQRDARRGGGGTSLFLIEPLPRARRGRARAGDGDDQGRIVCVPRVSEREVVILVD